MIQYRSIDANDEDEDEWKETIESEVRGLYRWTRLEWVGGTKLAKRTDCLDVYADTIWGDKVSAKLKAIAERYTIFITGYQGGKERELVYPY